uniref:Hexosyltransferase n=1 Tax=Panagrolaimus davidi TaxID=227884 RepID=A0A914P2Q9_9BILA
MAAGDKQICLCFANYLERSLLPLRFICYTDSDFLNVQQPIRKPLSACIKHVFPNTLADSKCSLNQNIEASIKPKLSKNFEKIIVIRSAPNAINYREYIRDTWKQTFPSEIPVVFVVGKGKSDDDVESEAKEHEDILQLDFIDSYFNLTLKMMATYGYFLKHSTVEQFMVINDDTIVNSTALMQYSNEMQKGENYVIGKVSRGYPRLFMPWLLWHVPSTMYNHKCYPPFVQGSSFIISRKAASEIFKHICDFPFVHLDDIMMGLVSNCVGTSLIHREGFDHHFLNHFTVFHYQYSRYSASKMRSLWKQINHLL